ncbi:MAG: hypothetical protein AB1416_05100 [Actinomycetota bacterium]
MDVTPSCVAGGASGGLIAQDASSPGLQTPPAATAEWRFFAPAGTLVSGIRASRTGYAELDDGWVVRLLDGAGGAIESCSSGPGVAHCDLGASGVPPGSTAQALTATGLATPSLAYGVACRGPAACQNGSGGTHLVALAVRGVTVVVDDPTPPTVAGVSGPLRAAAGWLRGAQSVSIAASDEGGGVSTIELLADGRDAPVASQALACDYTRPAPCPSAATQSLALDTASLGDGTHTLQAVAFDATKPWSTANRGASAVWAVQVDNTAPAVTALSVDGTVRPRSPFSLSWGPNPVDRGSAVVKAEWRVRSSGGATVSTGAVERTNPRGIDGLRVPRHGAWRVGVRLTDAAGNTGAEQSVTLRAGAAARADALGVRVVGRTLRIRLARVTRGVQQVRVLRARPRPALRKVLGAWRLRPLRARTLVVPVPPRARGQARLIVRWRPVGGLRWRSVLVTIRRAGVR